MTIQLDASSLNFRSGLELGRAARVFYSVKQLKQHFGPGSGKKFFRGFKISAHARPVRFVGGPGADRARARPAGRAQNAQVYIRDISETATPCRDPARPMRCRGILCVGGGALPGTTRRRRAPPAPAARKALRWRWSLVGTNGSPAWMVASGLDHLRLHLSRRRRWRLQGYFF
jgi:hypothetical protein